jgi:hypothetical protein
VLKTAKPVAGGTAIKCPKCAKAFRVPAEEEPEPEELADEEEAPRPSKTATRAERPAPRARPARRPAEDDEDESEEDARSARKPAKRRAEEDEEDEDEPPRKRRTQGKKKAGPSGVLIAALIGGVLLLLGGGGVGLYFLLRGDSKPKTAGGPKSDGDDNKGPKAVVYSTPQAVFDAVNAALKKKDYKTFIDCFMPEAQKDQVGRMAFGALSQQAAAQGEVKGRPNKFKEQYKHILAVLDKHGLKYEVTKKIQRDLSPAGMKKGQREVGALIKDPAAFFVDMMEALAKTPGMGPPPDMALPEMKLTELKITGNKATGVVVTNFAGKERKEPVEFARTDAGWRVAPDPKKEDGKP